MIFKKRAEEDFRVKEITSPQMKEVISRCADMYRGIPSWVSAEDNIKTINFAKAVCSETARLATQGIGISISGSARATWIQEQTDKVIPSRIQHWVEYGCAYGTVIIKPNGDGFDKFTPFEFIVTECDGNGNIIGAVFEDKYISDDKYYTRLEYHHFEEERWGDETVYPYYIENRAYVSNRIDDIGKPIALEDTKWAGMLEKTDPILKENGERIDSPMFGVFRTPQASNIDISSPLGLPVYAESIEEMKDLDVAYSRNVGEIFDSERIVLADDRLMYDSGQNLKKRTNPATKLARFVKNVFGSTPEDFYQEINPALNTEMRLAGINSLLSQIGYKCGFSNGYFVFNESTGIQTATGVEAEQQRTIQYIKSIREALKSCMDGAIYAMSIYADIQRINKPGNYDVVYDFEEITQNREEDRARAYQLTLNNFLTKEYYLVNYEGFSPEAARAMVEEAQPKEEPGFFQEE